MRLSDQMANPYLDPFQVKLIPTGDPLAEDAVEIHRRYPGIAATRLGSMRFGGPGVESVFLYPASLTAPAP